MWGKSCGVTCEQARDRLPSKQWILALHFELHCATKPSFHLICKGGHYANKRAWFEPTTSKYSGEPEDFV